MPIANFEQLCNGVGDVAGLKPPALSPDENGTQAFTVRLRDVDVSVLNFCEESADTAYLVAALGPMPPERAMGGWLALLHANGALAGLNAPAFSRNPDNGEALLQWACPLHALNVQEVYKRISDLADVAQQWRSDYFLDDEVDDDSNDTPLATQVPASVAQHASTAFSDLYRGVCNAIEQDVPALPSEPGGRAFALTIDGIGITVVHFAQYLPACFFLVVDFGVPSDAFEPAALMDANFSFLTERHTPVFSLDAASGHVVLRLPCPLDSASAEGTLQLGADLAQLLRAAAAIESCAQPR